MAENVSILLNGIAVGSVYALIGVGFSLIFRTSGVLNFAFSEFVMIGSLLGYTFLAGLGLPVGIVIVLAGLAGAALGAGSELAIFRTVRARGGVVSAIIASIGLLVLLNQVGFVVWGSEALSYPRHIGSGYVSVADLAISWTNIVVVLLVAGLVIGLELFLRASRWGIAVRAAADDPVPAELVGISARTTQVVSAATSGVMAGVAGVMLGSLYYASFSLDTIGVKGLTAAAIGGFGNVQGALLGGVVLGVVEAFAGVHVPSGYRDVVAYGLLILVLLIRPSGLLGRATRVD